MADAGVWRQQMDVLKAQFPTITLTSGYRAGSITATGNLSYHARGMAVDVTPRADIFEWIKAKYPNSKELIYSPMGNRQIWNGKEHMYSEPTRGDHWDHIHWAVTSLADASVGGGGAPAPAVSGSGSATADNPLIPDEIEQLYGFYKFVSDPGTWSRVGIAALAAVLLIIAFLALSRRQLNMGNVGTLVKGAVNAGK